LLHERFIADVNVQRPVTVARWAIETRRLRHECFIADENVLQPVAVARWATETADPARTLYRGC
jgi:hypothetical protein